MRLKLAMFLTLAVCSFSLSAQEEAPENWFNLDQSTDKVPGVSTEKTYKELLKGKTSQTVIVAVLDSGVDSDHEDLKDVMWINPGEIAGNGIDDDKNGYIDDIHGWNFIGGKDGKNIDKDALEVTRLYASLHKKFDGKDKSSLSGKEKKEYDKYMKCKKVIDEKQEQLAPQAMSITMIVEGFQSIRKALGKEDLTKEDIMGMETEDPALLQTVGIIKNVLGNQPGATVADVEDQLVDYNNYLQSQVAYHYNPDFDPRKDIVGDNYADQTEKNYGNNDVEGPDANHGTHVSGIIGAVRDNGVGMMGVANNVQIMSVRCVPDGDERDKDVANAIIYAVDNGASIINMSFGKSFSWNKDIVDKAVKYAKKNDVLLVHAAGNSGENTDVEDNFPNDNYNKKGFLGLGAKKAKNWIEVGAANWRGGEDLPASFSNYGADNVDIFAPGVDVYSTVVGDGYDPYQGTSMAAPVVAGVAAVLRSYYPTLSAEQVKNILLTSSVKVNAKVKQPGSGEMVDFSTLSQTSGVVNTFNAVKMAEKTKGKKKVKKPNVVTVP